MELLLTIEPQNLTGTSCVCAVDSLLFHGVMWLVYCYYTGHSLLGVSQRYRQQIQQSSLHMWDE